jgi:hypothetical protein
LELQTDLVKTQVATFDATVDWLLQSKEVLINVLNVFYLEDEDPAYGHGPEESTLTEDEYGDMIQPEKPEG